MAYLIGQKLLASQMNNMTPSGNVTAGGNVTVGGNLSVTGTGTIAGVLTALASRVPVLSDFTNNAVVATSQTTTSTSFVDLTTVGPSVTITSAGTLAIALFECVMGSASSPGSAMAIAVSGATTIAAADADAMKITASNSGFGFRATGFAVFAITPGSNTYTAKYKTSSLTSTFADRKILIFAP
jgi:hypothetical protein